MELVSVEQVLSHYFNVDFKRYEIYIKTQNAMREQFRAKVITSEEYGIRTPLDFVGRSEKQNVLIRYTAELNFREKGGENAKGPIEKLKCNEFMYWGMYLNLQAFLYSHPVDLLVLYNTDKEDTKKFTYKVRGDIAELLLTHFNENYRHLYDKTVPKMNHKNQMSLIV